MKISEVNIEKERKNLIAYLQPHEAQALFLLANLQSHMEPSFVYVAKENNRIIGVCGYYPTFKSCTIFSERSVASKAFAQTMLKNHPDANTLLGMAVMVEPAYEEYLLQGRKPIREPEIDFFELEMKNFKPFFIPNALIRQVTENDVDAVVHLHRLIHHISRDNPISEDERVKIRMSEVAFCVETDGEVVSVAISNGLAIHAFQILGVATDPIYQKRGYAKALCSHLIEFMREKGGEKAILFTGKENLAARKCYLDLGFKITDRYYFCIFSSV
jgi:ribosomal protein S18 acetylase RimI-like enzyme